MGCEFCYFCDQLQSHGVFHPQRFIGHVCMHECDATATNMTTISETLELIHTHENRSLYGISSTVLFKSLGQLLNMFFKLLESPIREMSAHTICIMQIEVRILYE